VRQLKPHKQSGPLKSSNSKPECHYAEGESEPQIKDTKCDIIARLQSHWKNALFHDTRIALVCKGQLEPKSRQEDKLLSHCKGNHGFFVDAVYFTS